VARRTGHYRTSRVSKFSELAAAGVSANAKLTYFYLALGPFSSFAGIGRVSMDSIAHDTGLSRAEIESALAELEKRPTPARSFIVYDREHGIVWVRDYLKDDPAREKDPQVLNESHRKGIENTLGDLAKDSPAVKKFRLYYHFTRYTPARGPAGGEGGGRAVPTTYTENNKQHPTSESDRARARETEASAARPVGGAPPPPTNPPTNPQTNTKTMVSKGTNGSHPLPAQEHVDIRRVMHRDRLVAEGMARLSADTLAGQIMAGEVQAYARNGCWPDGVKYDDQGQLVLVRAYFNDDCPDGRSDSGACIKSEYLPLFPLAEQRQCPAHRSPPPSYADVEREVRRERPDLSYDRVMYWSLLRESDYKAGQSPRPITEARP
jgi:hypothetical protein